MVGHRVFCCRISAPRSHLALNGVCLTFRATRAPKLASCAPAVARRRHIERCVTETAPVAAFFWNDPPDEWLSRLRAAGSRIWFQVGSVDEAKATLRRGAQELVVHGRGLADTTAPPRQHSRCRRQSSMQSLPCPSSLPVALPMVGPLLLRGHSASTRSGWGTPEFPDASTRGLRNRIVRARLVLELAVIVVSGANDLVRSLSADVIGARRRFRRFASVRPSPCLGRPMCEELAIRADSSAQVMMWSRLRRAV